MKEANDNVKRENLSEQVRVVQGDVLAADVSNADVVILYLATPLNEKLRPRLERLLKAGARVISHDYAVPGWKPNRTERTGDRHAHMFYVYDMPPTHE